MLRLLARRARVQLPLLSAVLAIVVLGATLLGVCALLLTVSQERALDVGMMRTRPDQVGVTAFVTGVRSQNAAAVAAQARAVLTDALAPLGSSSNLRASSALRQLGAKTQHPRRLAYLSGIEGLPDRARLTAGHWPQRSTGSGPLQAVVLEPTARGLGLHLGSRVQLADEAPPAAGRGTVNVVVVGIFRPRPGTGWDRDPLAAAGYDLSYQSVGFPELAHVYGPFVVDLGDLWASGATIDRLQVNAQPNLSAPTSAALGKVATSLTGADARLDTELGDRVQIERVASDLPGTLFTARAQQAVTRSAVLIVVLLGTVLTAAALGLAGRLVAALRSGETSMFSGLGAGRAQLVGAAVVEAGALAVLAAVLAVPLSSLIHAGLTHLPPLAAAGLATRPAVTGAQVAAVVLGAVLLAAVLVVPALRPDPASVRVTRERSGLLVRSGGDLGLLALAGVGWWQLRVQPATETGTDVVRVLAPVLCLLAGAALVLRFVTLPLRAGEWLARRSRGLVLALAAFEAARRTQAVAAALLLALAAATATFGLALGATWQRSQHDQAATRVGTDLALSVTDPALAGEGPSVAAATGGTVSPVTDRNIIIGQWFGDDGNPPRLVAVDTSRAGSLLRGRAPAGTTWAQVGAALAPRTPVAGVALPVGRAPAVTLTGTSQRGPQIRVRPRLVLQDREGLRTPCTIAAIPLDGHPHRLALCAPVEAGTSIVAMALRLDLDPDSPAAAVATGRSRLKIDLQIPTTTSPPPGTGSWAVTAVGEKPERLANGTATVSSGPAGTRVRASAGVDLNGLVVRPLQAMVTAFAPPETVPVAISSQIATALRARVGARLTVTVASTAVPVMVADVVPTVPSVPGGPAMLADVDVLSRALLASGELAPAVDAWWVGAPSRPAAATRARRLGLGAVVSRAEVSEQLTRSPLRIGLPAALLVLLPAVFLLALAGAILHVISDVASRALEIARLRGLGLSRRNILGGLLAQHGGMLVLLLAGGTVVGAVTSWAVVPLLIRSDTGSTPVPAALLRWPGLAGGGFLAALLITGLTATSVVIAVQVRRADAAHLRVGG